MASPEKAEQRVVEPVEDITEADYPTTQEDSAKIEACLATGIDQD